MKIDLGKKMPSPCDAPEVTKPSPAEPSVYYPSLYLDAKDSDLAKQLPKPGSTGKATIEFKVKRVSVASHEDDASCDVELEILSIEPQMKKGVTQYQAPETEESESAMDSLLENVS